MKEVVRFGCDGSYSFDNTCKLDFGSRCNRFEHRFRLNSFRSDVDSDGNARESLLKPKIKIKKKTSCLVSTVVFGQPDPPLDGLMRSMSNRKQKKKTKKKTRKEWEANRERLNKIQRPDGVIRLKLTRTEPSEKNRYDLIISADSRL